MQKQLIKCNIVYVWDNILDTGQLFVLVFKPIISQFIVWSIKHDNKVKTVTLLEPMVT